MKCRNQRREAGSKGGRGEGGEGREERGEGRGMRGEARQAEITCRDETEGSERDEDEGREG